MKDSKGRECMDNCHGTYDEKLEDNEQSHWWLKFGDIKRETASTTVAAQDQAISTNYFKNKILK